MAPPQNLRLLIVDDSAAMRSLLKALLQSQFNVARIFEAADGERAFAVFKANALDLVVTDIAMGPGDGLQLIENIRRFGDEDRRKVPIVAVTGFSTQTLVETLRDLGVHEVLTKPVTTRTLSDHVRAVFERPRSFVEGEDYFGPDRRRREDDTYNGPDRRGALILDDEEPPSPPKLWNANS
jgi:CheY-like chemotaxis protein